MVIHEDQCVDCGLPCFDSCPYKNVAVIYCDKCGEEAEYNIDGLDMCRMCAEEYINNEFDELTLLEKADLLGLSIERYGGLL